MEQFDELLKVALLGTERQAPSLRGSDDALGETLEALPREPPEAQVLSAAAVLSLYARAGHKGKADGTDAVQVCPQDASPRMSSKAGQFLARMLGGERREALGEFLLETNKRRQRVPEELLPGLLGEARAQSALRELALGVLGERGRWLVSQNPEWQFAAGDVQDEGTWHTGGKAARLAVLRHWRTTDAIKARHQLAATWAQEVAEDRVEFLRSFDIALSPEDEEFLEKALDDRSKEVRRIAAGLLSRLNDSKLSQRMWERVRGLVQFKDGKKPKVDVILPETLEKIAERDGIEPKAPGNWVGQKAWWVYQMVAAVPPNRWTQEWGKGPDQILEALGKKGEWRELLLEAWVRATQRSGDNAWAEALWARPLPTTIERGERDLWTGLMRALPAGRREKRVAEKIEELCEGKGDFELAHRLIQAYRWPWSAELGRTVLKMIQRRIGHASGAGDWYLRMVMKEVAYRIPVELLPQVLAGWPAQDSATDSWRSAVEDFIGTVQFRHDMLAAVAEGKPEARNQNPESNPNTE